MRVEHVADRVETRDVIDEQLINFVTSSGFMPVLVPNVLILNDSNLEISTLEYWLNTLKVEAIILSGGNNIGQYTQRDKTELELIKYALDNFIM